MSSPLSSSSGFSGCYKATCEAPRAKGTGSSRVSLAGGVLFAALMLAGAAVEIIYPATLAQFENLQQDAQLGFLSLALSGWMYRFAFVGMSANSCGLAGGPTNGRPAKVAGLGRFPIRPRSPAAFTRPARCVANIALDHSGFPAHARWLCWFYRWPAHPYRSLFLDVRTAVSYSPGCRGDYSSRQLRA